MNNFENDTDLTNEKNKRIQLNKVLEHPTIRRMLQRMPEGLTDIEKARYVYINLGKIFTLDTNYFLGNSNARGKILYKCRKYEYMDLDKLKLKENRYKGICINIARTYGAIMTSLNIPVFLSNDGTDPHLDGEIWCDKGNGELRKIPVDLQRDLLYIQTHQHTRNFGRNLSGTEVVVSDEELEQIDKKIGYDYDGERIFAKMISDYRKEIIGLTSKEKIELFMKKVENLPYFNELGVMEKKDLITTFKDQMLAGYERNNFYTTDIYKKDENEKYNRKGRIPVYSFKEEKEYYRYYFDKNERKYKSISDEELIKFMDSNDYYSRKEIPGLDKSREKFKLFKIIKNKNNKEER